MSTEARVGGFFALCAFVLFWIFLLETRSFTLGGIVTLLGLVFLGGMVIRRLL